MVHCSLYDMLGLFFVDPPRFGSSLGIFRTLSTADILVIIANSAYSLMLSISAYHAPPSRDTCLLCPDLSWKYSLSWQLPASQCLQVLHHRQAFMASHRYRWTSQINSCRNHPSRYNSLAHVYPDSCTVDATRWVLCTKYTVEIELPLGEHSLSLLQEPTS